MPSLAIEIVRGWGKVQRVSIAAHCMKLPAYDCELTQGVDLEFDDIRRGVPIGKILSGI